VIWDLPIRLFHWGLVMLVLIAWRSAEVSDMRTHLMAGSGVAGLLVFRLWWGLFGSSTARFSHFVKGPRAVFSYLLSLKTAKEEAGHNPMGGWSVLALLACLLLLTGFGLFAVDTDGLYSGPFSDRVDYDAGRAASHFHGVAFTVLEVLIGLHLTAILFYQLIKRHSLIAAMIIGRRDLLDDRPSALRPGSPLLLAVGLLLGAGTTFLLVRLSS
jgi:cytochrome b